MRWMSWPALGSGCGWLFALLVWLPATTRAAERVAPIVPAFERFHAQGEEAAQGGQLLLGELNCTSCHQTNQPQIQPKQAPILDSAGARIRPEYFRTFLANPHLVKPGATMPEVFAGWGEAEKREAIEALTHFLASTGMPGEQRIAPAAIAKGDDLFHRIGCVACHNPQQEGAEPLATSVPLGDLEAKYTVPSLAQFLASPLGVRPSGRMPHMNLQGDEARDLAAYLLRNLKDVQLPSNLKYAYHEGSWDKLPDFGQMQPRIAGETSGFDLSFTPRKDNFGVRFTGTLQLAREGEYTFHLHSDDGSKLWIDGQVVVDNDGVHSPSSKSGKAKLAAGRHAVQVDYFEVGGGEEVSVDIEGAGLGRQPLENHLVVEKKPDVADPPKFVINTALAAKGQQLFVSVGCASCHTMKVGEQTLASTTTAPPLVNLKGSGGCLGNTPSKKHPFYSLTDMQRKALVAGLEAVRQSSGELPPADQIVRTMKAMNCYACHSRGELGGVETARDSFFLTTQKEMGDEGRIPPPLTGVGAKITPEYLKTIFDTAEKDRPYMHTRMPRFGSENVGHLIAALGQADPAPQLREIKHSFSQRDIKQAGRLMVGAKGFSCIKCHTWGGVQATGVQSINMLKMTTRLKQEWFESYLLNPMAFRPGTRMPASWPEGQVLLPQILDGQASTQIRAVWEYLSDRDKATIPLGLGRDPIELIPESEPIVYRNFIEGAGTRAIGVGYPEKVNLAWDANGMRLAMIWQGMFIDASRHWTDRGAGSQPPLGDNVVRLDAGAPLAVLSDETAAWPATPAKEQGYQFRGYRLDKERRPTFLYRWNELEIAEQPLPVVEGDKVILRRTLTITARQPVEHLFYRAAVSNALKPAEGAVYQVSDEWSTRVSGQPLLRTNGGKAELLVPITFTNGKATIVQDYLW